MLLVGEGNFLLQTENIDKAMCLHVDEDTETDDAERIRDVGMEVK